MTDQLDLSSLRRDIDMANADLRNHAKTLSELTDRISAIQAWQRQADIASARQEEREKNMATKLDSIFSLGKALLITVLSGFGLALVTFIVKGGINV